MDIQLEKIIELIGGQAKGSINGSISRLSKIQEASSGDITFLSNHKYESYLYSTQATATIVQKDFVPKKNHQTLLIFVDDPYSAFTKLLQVFEFDSNNKSGIDSPSHIGENCKMGDSVYVGIFAYIGNHTTLGNHVKIHPQSYVGDDVVIGDHTIIKAGAKIASGSKIGSHCVIHENAVIGSDGFGFAPQQDGSYMRIPQTGIVRIEDHVSIGANTVIDRATMGETLLKQGAKIDNLIQVAHNVVIGKHTVIAAQSGVSGSTEIGDQCIIGGQCGFVGHIKVANKTQIGAQSGINKSIIKENTKQQGYPAFNHLDFMKSSAVFRKLPELKKQLDELNKKMLNLCEQIKAQELDESITKNRK